jgi:tyrosine-specific transport protein
MYHGGEKQIPLHSNPRILLESQKLLYKLTLGKIMKRKFFGSTLLVAGTSVGAGMLALPVATALAGFFPSAVALMIVWAIMCFTGLLVVEVNLWLPPNTSYISMTHATLGRTGQVVSWIIFALLLYSLLAAYIAGGGALLLLAVRNHFAVDWANWMGYLPWIVVVGFIIYLGVGVSDIVNRVLLIGLIVSFSLLATSVTAHVHWHYFAYHGHYFTLFLALPILFASFGYHIILPSVRDYMGEKFKLLPWIVVFGSLLPLLVYIVWEFLIFGLIPVGGKHGLTVILQSGQPSDLLTQTIVHLTQSNWLANVARFFIFFAIASSFIGVSLGLFDLLADGLHIKKTHFGRLVLAVLTFVPPFIFAMFYPKGFILALGFAGVFVAILHGILPMAMVWSGRYCKHLATGGYRVFGGRVALLLIFVVSCVVIFAEFFSHFG